MLSAVSHRLALAPDQLHHMKGSGEGGTHRVIPSVWPVGGAAEAAGRGGRGAVRCGARCGAVRGALLRQQRAGCLLFASRTCYTPRVSLRPDALRAPVRTTLSPHSRVSLRPDALRAPVRSTLSPHSRVSLRSDALRVDPRPALLYHRL